MSTVQLGGAFRKQTDYGPLADLVAGLRTSIVDELKAMILDEMAASVAGAVASMSPPQILVQPSDVSVTPNIRVDVPGEDDQGEIEAADRQTAMLKQMNDRLGMIVALLSKPVVREVTRDNNGQIIRVTETR